ncbi:PREDICTED: origin recognition complex subunit 4-like [Priapulus caudatus]|uniref:Origin recognition complex subunit 4 n=1 Tax=Priapulus caudatus TaxID=37621 RepID=A0ABM1EQD1_PRICU|nr:PREDICTED: origin recognition complex subunit 4-like [Priapulus caudatus]
MSSVCPQDVIELLEKRVKSRFSHRQIYMFSGLSFEQYVGFYASSLSLPASFPDRAFRSRWNEHVKSLCADESVLATLQRLYDNSRDVGVFHRLMLLPLSKVEETQPYPQAGHVVESGRRLSIDTKAAMLHEYHKFAMKRSAVQKYSRAVVLKAFEHLQALEFVVPTTEGSSGNIQKEYKLMSLLVEPGQVASTLQTYAGLPTEIQQWAQSSIC